MIAAEIKDRLLDVIRDRSPRPTELLDLLGVELSYRDVQDALCELLDAGQVELSSDRHLLALSRAA